MRSRRNPRGEDAPQIAANGLLDRRALLGRGALIAGAMTAGAAGSLTGAAAEPLSNGPWSLAPGRCRLTGSRPNTKPKWCAR